MADQDDKDLDNTCAICGRHLTDRIRSVAQPDLCVTCAGEEDQENNELE